MHGSKIVSLLVASLLLAGATTTAAASATGRIYPSIKVADNGLEDTPVMISATRPEGAMVDQAETLLVAAPHLAVTPLEPLAEGVYDVRVEGDGIVTEVKRGVHVFAGRDTHLSFVVRPGSGVHVVEYAVAGLSREEVAMRLARLDAEVKRLEIEVKSLKSPSP